MSKHEPLISVATVTYNHENYIEAALRSVLAQSEQDFELIVVDDGSTDGTAAAIRSVVDSRIRYIHQKNQGPGAAANTAVAAARGKYLALLSGDDLYHPERLRWQLETYRQGETRILFSDVDFVDDEGNPFQGRHYAKGVFDIQMTDQSSILRRFFDRGNFINAISFFSETKVLHSLGNPFDPTLYQLQDYDLWIRLIKRYRFEFMPQKTVRYRIRDAGRNLSAPSLKKEVRNLGERYLISQTFFDDCPDSLFREAFRDRLRNPNFSTSIERACEVAFVFLSSAWPTHRLIGVQHLHELLHRPEAREVLEQNYGYGNPEFAQDMFTVDVERLLVTYRTSLYIDSGSGYQEAETLRECADIYQPEFAFTFDLGASVVAKNLRWDPVENRFCTIWLDTVEWIDDEGNVRLLSVEELPTNGTLNEDGGLQFQTLDPMIQIPIQGRVRQVTLRGRWSILDEYSTTARINQILHENSVQLHQLNEQLHDHRNLIHQQNQTLHSQAQLRFQEQSYVNRLEGELSHLRNHMAHEENTLHLNHSELSSILSSRTFKIASVLRRGLNWIRGKRSA